MTPSRSPYSRLSAIARPLDPSWRTNLAVLWLMPVGGASALLWALGTGTESVPALLVAGVVGGGVVLGTWALGRELAPDDQIAAFVAMALGFGTLLLVSGTSLILVFLALMLCRVVNRTVGPPPTVLDRIGVLGLTGLSAWRLAAPELWSITALAFALDARYARRTAPSWISAAAAAALMGLQILSSPARWPSMDPLGGGPVGLALTLVIAAGFILVIRRTKSVRSPGDMTGEPLSPARVRAGMAVVTVLALRSLFLGAPAIAQTALVWATMAGVTLSSLVSRRPIQKD